MRYQGVKYDRDTLVRKLEAAQRNRLDFEAGRVTPKQLVGTGWKDSRSVAREYVARELACWSALLMVFDENEMEGQ